MELAKVYPPMSTGKSGAGGERPLCAKADAATWQHSAIQLRGPIGSARGIFQRYIDRNRLEMRLFNCPHRRGPIGLNQRLTQPRGQPRHAQLLPIFLASLRQFAQHRIYQTFKRGCAFAVARKRNGFIHDPMRIPPSAELDNRQTQDITHTKRRVFADMFGQQTVGAL